jgi:hypothetical protein
VGFFLLFSNKKEKKRKEKKIKLSTLEKKRNLFNVNYFFKEC